MSDPNKTLPDKQLFFPEGSLIVLIAHLGVGIFFIVACLAFPGNIETIKMLILGYYTLFSTFFLFFYHEQLRIRRIFLVWCVVGFIQLIFYFFNVRDLAWNKWAFDNVLRTLAGLPVALALYNSFRRMSVQREGKELVVGIRTLSKPTGWDFAATLIIPLVVLIVCLS